MPEQSRYSAQSFVMKDVQSTLMGAIRGVGLCTIHEGTDSYGPCKYLNSFLFSASVLIRDSCNQLYVELIYIFA